MLFHTLNWRKLAVQRKSDAPGQRSEDLQLVENEQKFIHHDEQELRQPNIG